MGCNASRKFVNQSTMNTQDQVQQYLDREQIKQNYENNIHGYNHTVSGSNNNSLHRNINNRV